jgi:hypothetical protein
MRRVIDMAKRKILGFELDGLPTVGENAEKMTAVRENLTLKVHTFKMKGIASMVEKRKLLEGKTEERKEMKNVTPGAIDVTFKKVDEKPKTIEAKKEEI